jgi:hypothetical protein
MECTVTVTVTVTVNVKGSSKFIVLSAYIILSAYIVLSSYFVLSAREPFNCRSLNVCEIHYSRSGKSYVITYWCAVLQLEKWMVIFNGFQRLLCTSFLLELRRSDSHLFCESQYFLLEIFLRVFEHAKNGCEIQLFKECRMLWHQ